MNVMFCLKIVENTHGFFLNFSDAPIWGLEIFGKMMIDDVLVWEVPCRVFFASLESLRNTNYMSI